jgi:hypothetical protein
MNLEWNNAPEKCKQWFEYQTLLFLKDIKVTKMTEMTQNDQNHVIRLKEHYSKYLALHLKLLMNKIFSKSSMSLLVILYDDHKNFVRRFVNSNSSEDQDWL